MLPGGFPAVFILPGKKQEFRLRHRGKIRFLSGKEAGQKGVKHLLMDSCIR